MRVDGINQQQQSFGALKVKSTQVNKLRTILLKMFEEDAKSARQFADTYEIVSKEQANNKVCDIIIRCEKENETDSMDNSAYLVAEVVKQKGKNETKVPFFVNYGTYNWDGKLVKQENVGNELVKWLEKVSRYATGMDKVKVIVTKMPLTQKADAYKAENFMDKLRDKLNLR